MEVGAEVAAEVSPEKAKLINKKSLITIGIQIPPVLDVEGIVKSLAVFFP